MRLRLTLLFSLVIIVPLGVLAWLGIERVKGEDEMQRMRVGELLEARLEILAASVDKTLKRREQELLAVNDIESAAPMRLRALQDNQRLVRQLFVLDPQGALLFPLNDAEASGEERAFLKRTAHIWQSGERFFRPSDDKNVSGHFGWYVWFWEEGMHLIFWQKLKDGRIVGAEVSRIALMADLVGELPDALSAGADPKQNLVALHDPNGRQIHGIGDYQPRPDEPPRARRMLEDPLGTFSLTYFVSPKAIDDMAGASSAANPVIGFAGLCLVVIAIAVYVFRENRREMREAAKRVTFVNQVSHELKTPLTNIRMYAELLDMALEEADEKSRAHIEVIVSESRRLSRLIANVLIFGRGQERRLAVHPAPHIVDEVIDKTLSQFAPSLECKGIEVTRDLHANHQVLVDADALEQILSNLIGNVEKYAASGKRLQVTSAGQGDQTVIHIHDNGPGIPRLARRKIFEPFFRVSGALTDGVTGTGIGLTISRDLARRHHGDLTLVPSETGTTFSLTLETPRV